MLVGQTIGSGAYRFEIQKELGSGAMGMVYKAQFHQDQKVREVALKVVALGLIGNEGAMARFEREASILKQLRHPNIVKLYATGHYRKTPFIAMEYIEGEALDRALARRGRLSWEEVVGYGKHLCEALQYAHEKGIIHRDLKPSNLMVTTEGILKLTDFGIAKDTDVTALTGANSTIGTAAYMSPEQCKGDKNLTNKSDLYSLGVVFFELLSNRKPFVADTTVDMFLKHVNEPPPRVGKIVPDLPPKLEYLILQLLEKDKDKRPTDAAWVGRMLAEVEEDAFARKSAGLDAASARRIDRPRGAGPIDEEDREAARVLRGKKKKKKKKTDAVPLFQQKWVKATGILLVLAAMAFGVYLAVRPPSAEKLSAAIAEARSPDDKIAAAQKYLAAYGDTPGELTDRAAQAYREGVAHKREDQLVKRFGVPKWRDDPEGDDPDAYKAAMQAIEAEKNGQLGIAAGLWEKVKARFPDEAKLPYTLDADKLAKARWVWVADDRLKTIQDAISVAGRMDIRINTERNNEKPIPFDPANPESVAVRATRYAQFGDGPKAYHLWDQVTTLVEKDPEQRALLLLAQARKAEVRDADNAGGKRVELLRKKVTEAEQTLGRLRAAPADRRKWIDLRMDCRDVIELYSDETDPQIRELVARADAVLKAAAKES